ncbi:MAG: GNAT family N-acetyltransferase [Candidatus Cloacimonetes bacterium]|nr:GNAT family N-acetyltransferase [Candidatus Cloacimonadota bacterium]
MIRFIKIEYGSKHYQKEIDLRKEYLRKPLKLSFSEEHLKKEKDDMHFGLFDEKGKIIACLVISKISSDIVHLKQMVVAEEKRKTGKGKKLLSFAEEYLKKEGISKIILHSRKDSVGFYQKSGYLIEGSEFIEVTIPHFKMAKTI